MRLTYLNVASFGSLNVSTLLPACCNCHCSVCFMLKTEIICKKIIDLKRAAPLHTNFVRLIPREPKYTGAINAKELPFIWASSIQATPHECDQKSWHATNGITSTLIMSTIFSSFNKLLNLDRKWQSIGDFLTWILQQDLLTCHKWWRTWVCLVWGPHGTHWSLLPPVPVSATQGASRCLLGKD